jgi:hypothetical protein
MNWTKFSDYNVEYQFLYQHYFPNILFSIFENLCFASLLLLQIGFSRVVSLVVLEDQGDNRTIVAWVFIYLNLKIISTY